MADQRGLSPEQALPAQEAPKPKPQDSGGGGASQGGADQMMQRQQEINRVNREQTNEKSSGGGGAFGAHGGGDGVGSGEVDVTPLPCLLLGISSSMAVMPSESDAGEKSFAPAGLVAGFYEQSGGIIAFLEKFAQTMDEAGQKDMDPAGPSGGKDGADGKEGGVEGKGGGGGKGAVKSAATSASSGVDEGYASGSENAKPAQLAGQKRGREAPANVNAPAAGKPSGYDSGYESDGPSAKRQATARSTQGVAVNSAMPAEEADFGAYRKYAASNNNNNATSGGSHGGGSHPPANAAANMYTASANNPAANAFATLPRTNSIQSKEPFEVAGLGHLTPSPTPSVGVSRDKGQSYGRG